VSEAALTQILKRLNEITPQNLSSALKTLAEVPSGKKALNEKSGEWRDKVEERLQQSLSEGMPHVQLLFNLAYLDAHLS